MMAIAARVKLLNFPENLSFMSSKDGESLKGDETLDRPIIQRYYLLQENTGFGYHLEMLPVVQFLKKAVLQYRVEVEALEHARHLRMLRQRNFSHIIHDGDINSCQSSCMPNSQIPTTRVSAERNVPSTSIVFPSASDDGSFDEHDNPQRSVGVGIGKAVVPQASPMIPKANSLLKFEPGHDFE
eukprot:Gb_04184 [translate_table: standard]